MAKTATKTTTKAPAKPTETLSVEERLTAIEKDIRGRNPDDRRIVPQDKEPADH